MNPPFAITSDKKSNSPLTKDIVTMGSAPRSSVASCATPSKAALQKEKRELGKFVSALTRIASLRKTVTAVSYVFEEGKFHSSWSSSSNAASPKKRKRTAGNDVAESCTSSDLLRAKTSSSSSNGATQCLSPTCITSKLNFSDGTVEIRTDNTLLPLLSTPEEKNSDPTPRNVHQGDRTCSLSGHIVAATPPRSARGQLSSGSTGRPRRQKKAPQHFKEHVRYNMSKTPQFKRNLAFLSRMRNLDDNSTASRDLAGSSSDNFARPMGESVVWKPESRDAWFECSNEMSALCAEAALRSALSLGKAMSTSLTCPPTLERQDDGEKRIIPTPLSNEYIRDRLDIDDPLRGFQVRHATGGWLQGFIIWTTFTTWTRYFKWDSHHPKSGMMSTGADKGRLWDTDGKLAVALEAQSRSGDPLDCGVIWPRIAEIGLVAGLGCGEYLLRMALDDISRLDQYEYVVLQATETSYRFYEKFGFVRVGAVCKYGSSKSICGYRHWTYADEENLAEHGGPSYMMAKKLNRRNDSSQNTCNFLDAIEQESVDRKPTILSMSKQEEFFTPNENTSIDAWLKEVDVQTRGKKIESRQTTPTRRVLGRNSRVENTPRPVAASRRKAASKTPDAAKVGQDAKTGNGATPAGNKRRRKN